MSFHRIPVQPTLRSLMLRSPCLQQMPKLLASNNLARNARLKTADGSQDWTHGKDGLKFGKNQDVPISGWLIGGLIAEIKWVGSAHQIETKGGWTKVLVNDAKLEW